MLLALFRVARRSFRFIARLFQLIAPHLPYACSPKPPMFLCARHGDKPAARMEAATLRHCFGVTSRERNVACSGTQCLRRPQRTMVCGYIPGWPRS